MKEWDDSCDASAGAADNCTIVPFGVGMTPIPRVERLYFHFGEAISTAVYDGDGDDRDKCVELRDKTQAAIEDGLRYLLAYRDDAPHRKPTQRIRSKLRGGSS